MALFIKDQTISMVEARALAVRAKADLLTALEPVLHDGILLNAKLAEAGYDQVIVSLDRLIAAGVR